MKLLQLRNLIFILFICVLGISCSGSSTGEMEREMQNPDIITFTGKVENTSSQSSSNQGTLNTIEGAVVTAARVTAEGNLQTIGEGRAETNARGEYTLEVDVPGVANFANRVVIVAENEGESAKAFITAEVERGSSFTVQPINFETSAETEVFQNVIANGDSDRINNADITGVVESELAADIGNNAQNAAVIEVALAMSAEPKKIYYAQQGIKRSGDERGLVREFKQEAQLRLESELDAATSAEEKQTAFNTFLRAWSSAELDAGIEAWAVAESDDFAARVLIQESAELSTNAQSEVRRQIYFFVAVAIDAAVQAEAEVLGASEATVNALADAGATLLADILSTTNASKDNIDSVFMRFNENVQAALNNDASINGSAFVTANTEISGSAGLKSSLESTLSGTSNLDTMLNGYIEFNEGVQSIVNTNFTEASEAEAEAYTRLLVVINLAS